jgi:galactose mutarotase-like enzyme
LSIDLRGARFTARVEEKGAELKSLASIETGAEHVWPGDPSWWTGSAPILFPVVGGLRDGCYTHAGRRYALPNHGFARRSPFAVRSREDDAVELLLASSDETRAGYPFDFTLAVSFRLRENGLSVRYAVTNTGRDRMLFSIGSHPGFLVPFAGGSLDDHAIRFDQPEPGPRWFLDPASNCVIAGQTEDALHGGSLLPLTVGLFDRGALVFKAPRSRRFTLLNRLSARSLSVVTEGAPYLGIWTKPGSPGRVPPFVCIEPWHGVPDSTAASGQLEEKEGILRLEPGAVFRTGYDIEIE